MLRSAARVILTLLVVVSISSCSESATSVRRTPVHIALEPQFSPGAQAILQSLGAFAVTLDNVHVVVRTESAGEAIGPVLKDTVVAFPATADQITIDLDLTIQADQQTVAATVELREGTTAYFAGTQDFVAKRGETAATGEPIAMSYVGPGAAVTSMTITPTVLSQPVTLAPSTSFTFGVQAFDQLKRLVTDLPVTWRVSDATIATVTQNGVVTSTGKAGSTTLTVTGLNGVSTSATVDVQPVAKLVVLQGDNQTAIVGTALTTKLSVQASAANNHMVAGATINFSGLNGSGSVSPPSATTDVGGVAQTTMTLGQGIGTYTFTATVAGASSVTTRVTATATAAIAAALGIVAGNNQSDTVRATLGQALTVKITDSFGNPVAQQPVDFQVTAGRAGLLAAPGTAPQTLLHVVTGTDGVATALLVADTLAGAIRVTATVPQTTIAPVTFTATVAPGVARKLVMVQQPSPKAQATIVLGTQPKVQITDQFGNAVAAGGVAISANLFNECQLIACGRLLPTNGGTPSLSRTPEAHITTRAAPRTRQIAATTTVSSRLGVPTSIERTRSVSDTFPRGLAGKTTVTTDASGLATFSDLTLNLSVGPWQLSFSDANNSLGLAVSNNIDLSPGPVESIIASSLPDSSVILAAGDTLFPSVRIIDKVANGIPGVSVTWTVPLDGFSTFDGGTTTATTTTDANGIAAPGRWVTLVGARVFKILATPNPANIENAPLTLWAFVGALQIP